MTVTAAASSLRYILGLDIGASSIGWAILKIDAKGRPCGIERLGVRCFDAGVEGDIAAGRDSSRAAARRQNRQLRRQIKRRAQRQREAFRILRRAGLLPGDSAQTPDERHELLLTLDRELRARHIPSGDRAKGHLLPYILRAKALSAELEPHELGRAFYHLAQRRGFKSNRKADSSSSDEEPGKVKADIAALASRLNGQTLGQLFASLDPEAERIRQRWTGRKMYEDEFDRIWQAQTEFKPDLLTNDLRKRLRRALFHQRPLKSQKGLVGRCELEPSRRRAPLACPVAQRFRVLQTVNNLRLRLPGEAERPLNRKERETLFQALHDAPDLTWAASRKALGLPKAAKFNLEEMDEKRLVGNRSRSKLLPIFGERWDQLDEAEQERVVSDVLHYQKREGLIRRAQAAWGLGREQAGELAETHLEHGYARHSKSALQKLLAAMERDGVTYGEARKAVYPESFKSTAPLDDLPPVRKALPDLRNPAVTRALTELRKVVNEILRRYGKPQTVRVELARDLRRSRDERRKVTERIRQQQGRRRQAIEAVLRELPGFDPRPADVERVLLAEECNWKCPYTGRPISMRTLLGPNAEFDIEHIFPREYLDDSFRNKTLCYHETNRHKKRNRLPIDAFGATAEWEAILDRVREFKGADAKEKLRRFETDSVDPDGFVARQLNDTRYNSRLAADYLALLFGGRSDLDGRRRIDTVAGGVTALVRRSLSASKGRDNHLHHALDALIVALTSPGIVHDIAAAAGAEYSERFHPHVSDPWSMFRQELRDKLDAIAVSHRPNRRLRGPLHEETVYSKPHDKAHRVRKRLDQLSEPMLKQIADPVVRDLVSERFHELRSQNKKFKTPKEAFAGEENHPYLVAKDGRTIPIHSVRVGINDKPVPLGEGTKKRFVKPGANHCLAVVAIRGKNGRESWTMRPLTLLEAANRVRRKESLVPTDLPDGERIVMILFKGDYLLLDDPDGVRRLYHVRRLSADEIVVRLHDDARPDKEFSGAERSRFRIRSANDFQKRRAEKLIVEPLGDIRRAGLLG